MRLLVLPGYLQSGKVLAEKGSTFRKLMAKLGHTLDYIDPPLIINSYTDLGFKLGDTQQECDSKWSQIVAANCNRCWFQHNEDGYVGLDDTYKYLVTYIKEHGPYQGLVGFSQGAGMLLMMSSHKEFEFAMCIAFSGFCLTVGQLTHDRIEEYINEVHVDPRYQQYYSDIPASTRYFHVYGKSDMIVAPIRSKFGAWVFGGQEFEFDGGHMMPNKKPFLRDFISKLNDSLINM